MFASTNLVQETLDLTFLSSWNGSTSVLSMLDSPDLGTYEETGEPRVVPDRQDVLERVQPCRRGGW